MSLHRLATSFCTRLLRGSLRPTGRLSRFTLDTYITPTLYLSLNKLLVENPAVSYEQFEQTLLPAIHPSVVPVETLENNIRFRTWVRAAYLEKRFGSWPSRREYLEEHELTSRELWKKAAELILRPDKLPSKQSIEELFSVSGWNKSPDADEDSRKYELREVLAATSSASQKDNAVEGARQELQQWGLEDVLESIGCCIYGMNEFNLFCERHQVFDMLHSDYIDALAAEVYNSAQKIAKSSARKKSQGEPITVLEVGAGSGRLSHMLRSKLHDNSFKPRSSGGKRKSWGISPDSIEVVATDSGVWRLANQRFPVSRMDYIDALKRYQPDIVLCSWMPMGDDWTSNFRECPSVMEYILIGETDAGCCGHPWRTWGYQSADAHQSDKYERPSVDVFDLISRVGSEDYWRSKNQKAKGKNEEIDKPPFEVDGYKRNNLKQVSELQLSRYDRSTCASNSRTVCFSKL